MKATLSLTLGCLIAAFAIGMTQFSTSQRIADNQQSYANAQLLALLPDALSLDAIGENLYRADLASAGSAYLFRAVTPNAYNGPVDFWIAVDERPSVLGLRVISHRETPGIGDFIDSEVSSWNEQFLQANLQNQWRIRRDEGDFDHRSGATITSRAMTVGVGEALTFANGALPDWQHNKARQP